MAKRRIADLFPNRAFETVVMSGANVLTFSQLQFGVGLFQGVAALIHRIEWYPTNPSLVEMVAATDWMIMALTNRDDLTALNPTNQSVLAYKEYLTQIVGSATNFIHIELPLVSDFSGLIGGGLIIPANPLYLAMVTFGAAAASSVRVIVYMTFKELTDAEYIELVQTIMPANF